MAETNAAIKGTFIGEIDGVKYYTDGVKYGNFSIGATIAYLSTSAQFDIYSGQWTGSYSFGSSSQVVFTADGDGNVNVGLDGKVLLASVSAGVVTYKDGTKGVFAGAALGNALASLGVSIDGTFKTQTNLSKYNSISVSSTGIVNKVEFFPGTLKYPNVMVQVSTYEQGKLTSRERNNIGDQRLAADMAAGIAPLGLQSRCFLPGTPILMADGSTKPIEEVRPGDAVAAFDPRVQQGLGLLKPGKVKRTFTNVTETIVNLRGLKMTPGHVVLTDDGEWEKIAVVLRDDGGIVEQRGSKALRVRARTGAEIGSIEDTPILVLFNDPETRKQRLAKVRAGIPALAQAIDDKTMRTVSMADVLLMQGYTIEPDGTIICKDGKRYDATPWASEQETPLDLALRENWVLALDGEPFTPPWILDLPTDDEEVGRMVVNDGPQPVNAAGPRQPAMTRNPIGLATSNATPRPLNRKQRRKSTAKLRAVK